MTGDPELLPPEDITRIFREGERAGDFKICPCGIHYDGPGSLCPVCVRREERDLRELEKLDRSIIGETARCRPANENRLRGLP
jgi:hypothetical protein